VTWKATGPSGDYVLTLDVTAVSRGSGRTVNVEAGESASWAGPVFAMSGCRATGRFGLTLPPGDHTMRLFRFNPDVAGPVTKAVVTQAVSITR
jgi:hypothetical protein